MNHDDAETLIRKTLHEIAPEADLSRLGSDDDLRDTLGLDSLDFLQMVEVLSERSGRRIDEEDYPQLATMTTATAFLSTAG